MKEYKLETSIFWSKVTKEKDHILKKSELEIQGLLDRYSEEGWSLVSTEAVSFGAAIYFYHYFARDI
ncbi:MAG: DUF4177 domain-containing protein [Saprospiraceae bacterium]|nr:DUF4177 domain-containing protein [Saprospiraceae bacterium]